MHSNESESILNLCGDISSGFIANNRHRSGYSTSRRSGGRCGVCTHTYSNIHEQCNIDCSYLCRCGWQFPQRRHIDTVAHRHKQTHTHTNMWPVISCSMVRCGLARASPAAFVPTFCSLSSYTIFFLLRFHCSESRCSTLFITIDQQLHSTYG